MPDFRYECVDPTGKKCKGVIFSESREGALTSLKDKKLIPTSINEVVARQPQNAPGLGGVSVQRLAMYTRKFAELSKTDIPLSEQFEILSEEEEGYMLREASAHVAHETGLGRPLAEAMTERPRVFSKLYIKMVQAGLSSGTLDRVAENLAKLYEAENTLRKKMVSKLVYPAILLIFCFLAAIVLRWVGFVSDALFGSIMAIWLIIGMLVLLGITRPGYAIYRQIGFRLPWIGKLMRNINLARFCRIFGLQYGAGVPILESLEVSKEVLQDPTLERAVSGVQKRVNAGMDLRDAMVASGSFPKRIVGMVGTGEKAGGVDYMFQKLAEYYELDIDTQSTIMTTVLYFVVFMAVAGTIVTVVLSAWGSYFGMINDLIEGV